jgi:hypothetical protein
MAVPMKLATATLRMELFDEWGSMFFPPAPETHTGANEVER